ncbi:unnamed protein product [Gordionus sp. m RMFG-2023]
MKLKVIEINVQIIIYNYAIFSNILWSLAYPEIDRNNTKISSLYRIANINLCQVPLYSTDHQINYNNFNYKSLREHIFCNRLSLKSSSSVPKEHNKNLPHKGKRRNHKYAKDGSVSKKRSYSKKYPQVKGYHFIKNIIDDWFIQTEKGHISMTNINDKFKVHILGLFPNEYVTVNDPILNSFHDPTKLNNLESLIAIFEAARYYERRSVFQAVHLANFDVMKKNYSFILDIKTVYSEVINKLLDIKKNKISSLY